ncbi:MAG TPA: hypothetical protein PKE45_00320 [Caldilineaceae bacterium]|nr:hypothetical protein [Caldilineaceae bacterium]
MSRRTTPTPWTTPRDEDSRIYTLVTSDVYALRISSTGNEARVELAIATGYGTPSGASAAPSLVSGGGNWAGQLAIVTHVHDGLRSAWGWPASTAPAPPTSTPNGLRQPPPPLRQTGWDGGVCARPSNQWGG